MHNTETYYLIDFENVKDAGLVCSGNFTNNDHIHIFSTENALKINLKSLVQFNNASELNTHIVAAGKQSLDKHLLLYLGYLIGLNNKTQKNCKYTIVSKDKGFDDIILFFKDLINANIFRQDTLDTEKM